MGCGFYMDIIYNRPNQKSRRQSLRKNLPSPEILLWLKLKNKQMHGHKFRRQYGVGQYIVDFFCAEKNLAIEIDGESHFIDPEQLHDKERQERIEAYGIKFLRFTNAEVMQNIQGVLQRIMDTLESN